MGTFSVVLQVSNPFTQSTATVDALVDSGSTYSAMPVAYEAGWTDGLPIVPPTAERVRAFLDASGRSVDDWPITCLQAGVWATLGGT
jgi:hypothetical protein